MTGRLAPYFPVFTICLALSQCKVPLHGWWLQIEVNQHPSHAHSSSFNVLGGQLFFNNGAIYKTCAFATCISEIRFSAFNIS
jgi:hypothetical protein